MKMKEQKHFGNENVSYHELLHDLMLPVSYAHKDWHNEEIERLFLEGMVDGKWVEDSVVVERHAYDTITDEDGAVFIMEDNRKKLVKAPNVFYYRIPEDTQSISDTVFIDCTSLEILDVPYQIKTSILEEALLWLEEDIIVNRYDWTYDNTISDELVTEIANGWTDEFGFVYSQDRKRLLKAPSSFKEYYILEGVEKIERLAFVGCSFETLNIPYTCRLQDVPEAEYPVFGSDRVAGEVIPWCMPYHFFKDRLPYDEEPACFLDLEKPNNHIMADIQKNPNDLFGDESYLSHLKCTCNKEDMKDPMFWIIKPDDRYMGYAVSMHLSGGEKENHYDTNVVFITNDLSSMKNRMMELSLLRYIKQHLGAPLLLTLKASATGANDNIMKAVCLEKLPIRWYDTDNQAYEIFAYSSEQLGDLEHLMGRVNDIGQDLIYHKDWGILPDEFNFTIGEDGAEYGMRDGIKILRAVPNVPYYRISEDVMEIEDYALELCSELWDIDVPYTISDYEIQKALDHSHYPIRCHKWDWPYDCSISEKLEKEIAEGWTDEFGYVYSQDRKRLLKAAPEVGEYWIPETVEKIERLAFVHCHFETLHIPYTCHLYDLPDDEWPIFGREDIQGCDLIWEVPYAEQDHLTEALYVAEDDCIEDEYGVVYTKNMKRLLYAKSPYDGPANKIAHMTEYTVPEGVETICSFAFLVCKEFLTLRLPHTVKVIGDNLFGEEGGEILYYSSASL